VAYYALMRGRISTDALATADPAYATAPEPQPSIGAATRSDAEETS